MRADFKVSLPSLITQLCLEKVRFSINETVKIITALECHYIETLIMIYCQFSSFTDVYVKNEQKKS